MSKKNNKKEKVYQVYGVNNCLPVINNPNYNIVNIFILDEKVSHYKKIFAYEKYRQKIYHQPQGLLK